MKSSTELIYTDPSMKKMILTNFYLMMQFMDVLLFEDCASVQYIIIVKSKGKCLYVDTFKS